MSNDIAALVGALHSPGRGCLRRKDSQVYRDRAVGIWRYCAEADIIVLRIRVTAGELVIGWGWMLRVCPPQVVGSVVVPLVDVVVILLDKRLSLSSRRKSRRRWSATVAQ